MAQTPREIIDEGKLGTWQIAAILIAFGIIVGPVNLFVIARQGRRHRLFWTTPLISLIASLLLIALDITASLSTEDRLRRLIDAVREALPCDAAVVLRLEGDELVPSAWHGLVEGGGFEPP